jgi:hypothetical protein
MTDERVSEVSCTDDELIVALMDARIVRVPLAWFPPLQSASPEQRANWQCRGDGYIIFWPSIDHRISTAQLLRGPIMGH